MLVSAFRATLEEVIEADVILHVRDVAHEDAEAQGEDVRAILRDLGVDPDDDHRLVEVWNKIDLLDEPRREAIRNAAGRRRGAAKPYVISASTGEGLRELLAGVEDRLSAGHATMLIDVAPTDGEGLHWLYENAEILDRNADDDGVVHLRARVSPERMPRLMKRFPEAQTAQAKRSRKKKVAI
jgi:GTP-binding protein HflX